MRVITVSGEGRVTADVLQPWSEVDVVSAVTGEEREFLAAEVPSGVVERTADGREVLETVDGLRLVFDSEGFATVYDDMEVVRGPGIFMVIEVLPE